MSTQTRLGFWHHNSLFAMRLLAEAKDEKDVTVVIMDTTDQIGGPLARALTEKKGMNLPAHEAKVAAKNLQPTLVAVLPTELVRNVLSEANPTVVRQLGTSAPDGRVWVAIVAAGGTTLMAVPRVEIPVEGHG